PSRLTILTDNTNTSTSSPHSALYQRTTVILQVSVDIRVRCNIDLRVLHVPGDDNTVADAISRSHIATVFEHAPDIVLDTFQP
ncbi:hypothetical protein BDZ89DRAFT_901188, partial [Hymenopellis radicata]